MSDCELIFKGPKLKIERCLQKSLLYDLSDYTSDIKITAEYEKSYCGCCENDEHNTKSYNVKELFDFMYDIDESKDKILSGIESEEVKKLRDIIEEKVSQIEELQDKILSYKKILQEK